MSGSTLITTSINSVSRAWTDSDLDFTPDCELTNFQANGECRPISNFNFGLQNPNAVKYADDLIRGWGNRDYLWDASAEIQHELTQRVSLKGGWYHN